VKDKKTRTDVTSDASSARLHGASRRFVRFRPSPDLHEIAPTGTHSRLKPQKMRDAEIAIAIRRDSAAQSDTERVDLAEPMPDMTRSLSSTSFHSFPLSLRQDALISLGDAHCVARRGGQLPPPTRPYPDARL
jgi:hypothetical protein